MKRKPVRMRIGYRDYILRWRRRVDKENSLGECVNAGMHTNFQGRITIRAGLDRAEEANTILHEILHALWYTQGIQMDGKTEERAVNGLANGLCAFIRDNPVLAKKLLRMLTP